MGNAGRVLMIPKGDYNPATPYEMLDCVYYNGRSYVCKQASTGHAPTDIMYWQPMTPDSSAEIQALTNYTADTGVKNQLNTKALLDISTSAGITYSLNADWSIDVQAGTTTAELIILSTYRSKGVAIPYKPNTKYIFSIGENKKQANLALQVLCKETSSSSWSTLGSGTNVDSVEFTTPATMYELWIRLDVASGKAVTATTLFPMVRDATITDSTYQPYAKTNVELTQDVTIENISDSFYDSLETGISVLDAAVYKQGKHIFGSFVVQSTDAFEVSSATAIMTLKYAPIVSINTFFALANAQWGSVMSLGYMYVNSASKSMTLEVRDADKHFAKIMIDYAIA